MEKQEAAEKLERTFTSIFFDMRGFYAFDVTTMRDHALQKKEDTTNLIQLVKKDSDSNEDLLFLSEATNFYNYYFEVLVTRTT